MLAMKVFADSSKDSIPTLERIGTYLCERKDYTCQFGNKPEWIGSRVHGVLICLDQWF